MSLGGGDQTPRKKVARAVHNAGMAPQYDFKLTGRGRRRFDEPLIEDELFDIGRSCRSAAIIRGWKHGSLRA